MLNEDNTQNSVANVESKTLNSVYQNLISPSLGRRIFTVKPTKTPLGALYNIVKNANNDGIRVIKEQVKLIESTELPKTIEVSQELVQDIYTQFGEESLNGIIRFLRAYANDIENEETIKFLDAQCQSEPTLNLSGKSNIEKWHELSYKCQELVLKANSVGKITYEAFFVMPYKCACYYMGINSTLIRTDMPNSDDLFIGTNGLTHYFVNPFVDSNTCYVGLRETTYNGKGGAVFSPYVDEIKVAKDSNNGRSKYFIYDRFAITPNPIHTQNTPIMFKFDVIN